MQRQRIIGLVGTIGSGKSTAGKRLCDRHGYVNVPFAKQFKDMLRAMGLTDRELDGDLKEVPSDTLMGRTPRHAMQMLGTGWGRNTIHPDIWVHLWQRAAEKAGPLVVVDDVRHLNEATRISQLGGILVRIRRSSMEPVGAGDLLLDGTLAKSLGVAAHSSETEPSMIVCDWTILNNGTIDDLCRSVDDSTAKYRSRG